MSQLDPQLASIDPTALEQAHGGLPVGKLFKAAKDAYDAAAPVVKKVAPFINPIRAARNIWSRATDDK